MNEADNSNVSQGSLNSRVTLELGPETLATLKMILTRDSAKSGRLSIVTDLIKEFGGGLFRMVMPFATPYLIALWSGLAAAAIGGWKVIMRGWLFF